MEKEYFVERLKAIRKESTAARAARQSQSGLATVDEGGAAGADVGAVDGAEEADPLPDDNDESNVVEIPVEAIEEEEITAPDVEMKKKFRKKMPAALTQAELQAREMAEGQAKQRTGRRSLVRGHGSVDEDLEMVMYKRKMDELALFTEEEKDIQGTPMTPGISPSVAMYMAETVVISESALARYRRVFDVVKSEDALELSLEQLCDGLKQVNHALLSDKMVDYCLYVLDVVNDAQEYEVPRDFKLFSTVARLAERMVPPTSSTFPTRLAFFVSFPHESVLHFGSCVCYNVRLTEG